MLGMAAAVRCAPLEWRQQLDIRALTTWQTFLGVWDTCGALQIVVRMFTKMVYLRRSTHHPEMVCTSSKTRRLRITFEVKQVFSKHRYKTIWRRHSGIVDRCFLVQRVDNLLLRFANSNIY